MRLPSELEKTYGIYGSRCETGVGAIPRDSLAASERGRRNECKKLAFLDDQIHILNPQPKMKTSFLLNLIG